MLEFVKRAKILFLASILAIAAFTYFAIYKLMETRLIQGEFDKFMEHGNSNYMIMDNVIEGFVQSAQSLSRKTKIKNEIVSYNSGQIDMDELKEYTQPIYEDSIESFQNLIYAQRVVDYQTIALYGADKDSWQSKPALSAGIDTLVVSLLKLDGGIYAMVNSPIVSDDVFLGADNVVFDMTQVINGLSSKKYSVDIKDEAEFNSIRQTAKVVINGSYSMLYDCGEYYLFGKPLVGTNYMCVTVQKSYLLAESKSISLRILFSTALFFAVLLVAFYFVLIRYAKQMLKRTEKSKKKYQALAYRDALTGAYTRAFLNFWSRSVFQFDGKYCVVVIDIDNMKYINDTFGHAMGDDVLKGFSAVISSIVRSGDVVARLGGDEFLIILENADEDTGSRIMDHVTAMIDSEFTYQFKVEFSYGISKANKQSGLKDAVKRADLEMYKQKELKKSNEEGKGES